MGTLQDARLSKRDHVAVRSKSDGGGQAGGGGVLQAGRSPRRGVLQRHHGEERSVRGEGSRRGGQAGQAARVLQPRQAPGHGRGRAGGDNIVKQKWAGRMDLPMTEVGTAALFAGEVYAWFCVGEIVGRGGGLTG